MKRLTFAGTDKTLARLVVEQSDASNPPITARAPHCPLWADGRVAWTLHILEQQPPLDGSACKHQQLDDGVERLSLANRPAALPELVVSVRWAPTLSKRLAALLALPIGEAMDAIPSQVSR